MNLTHINLTKRILVVAGAAGLAVTGLAIPQSSAGTGADQETLSFRAIVKPRDTKSVDVRPRGDSLGDRHIASMTLRKGGQIAGRLEGVCTTVDNTYDGHMCTLVVILADGRIALEGAGVAKRIPGVGGRGDIFAITGGTGRYLGADGVLTVEPGDNGDRLTIELNS